MMKPILTSIAALAVLTGCTGDRTGLTSFYREAGAVVDSGNFGNATMNNILVQTNPEEFALNLNRRFSEEVPTTVNFAFNSTALDDQARAVLVRQADWILQFPEVRFKVYGHTDLVGTDAYNRNLGQRRANAVVDFLVAQGIARSRLEAAVSFGETQPLIVTEGRERANRRTVTEVLGWVADHPLVLNGKYAEVIFREYIASAVPGKTIAGVSSEFGG